MNLLDVREPLVAFRAWYTCEHPGAAAPAGGDGLYSIGLGISWSSGVNTAACRYRPSMGLRALHLPGEEAPVERCQCGIYSYGSLETAKRYRDECHPELRTLQVLGAIRIWGKTLIARVRDGAGLRYRSQYAEVLALLREDGGARGAQELAQAMGVPAVAARYLEPYARELGRQLRPEVRV
jgi:hypothetical protein